MKTLESAGSHSFLCTEPPHRKNGHLNSDSLVCSKNTEYYLGRPALQGSYWSSLSSGHTQWKLTTTNMFTHKHAELAA